MSKEQLIERAIGKYFIDNGARVDSEVMVYDMSRCKPLSAAVLRVWIESELEDNYD